MIDLLWRLEIGNGVIDCAISKERRVVVAGDVNGKVLVSNYYGEVQTRYSYDLPVWGVDINSSANVVAVGLASKVPPEGALMVLESGEVVLEKHFDSPVWDVRILDESSKILASTWKNGLACYDMKSGRVEIIDFRSSLFGISIGPNQRIFVTSSNEGIYSLDVHDLTSATLVSRGTRACYKNVFAPKREKVFYGSSSNIISVLDLKSMVEKHYTTIFDQICGMAVLDDYILYGDLVGNFCICHVDRPNIPIFYKRYDGPVWSIAADEDRSLLFVACGDGNLYCHKVNTTQSSKADIWYIDKLPIDPSVLSGTKIFICYASEDRPAAKLLYESLRSVGCTPWMDVYNILPGQDWRYETKRAIQTSDFVIVCLSKNAVSKRGFMQKELKYALEILEQMPEGRVFLIPVRLDNCTVPDRISDRQWVDLFSEDGFYKLLLAIYFEKIRASS